MYVRERQSKDGDERDGKETKASPCRAELITHFTIPTLMIALKVKLYTALACFKCSD